MIYACLLELQLYGAEIDISNKFFDILKTRQTDCKDKKKYFP